MGRRPSRSFLLATFASSRGVPALALIAAQRGSLHGSGPAATDLSSASPTTVASHRCVVKAPAPS